MEAAEAPTEKVELSKEQVFSRRVLLLSVGIATIIIDQLTKEWALATLDGDPMEGPFGSGFTLVFNRGSAFSLGEGLGPLFGLLALAVSISVVWFVKSVDNRMVVVGLGLLQGGALGNVIDRAFRDGDGFMGGAVVDFIEIGSWWPVFNIADVAIVVSAAVILIAGNRG